MSNIMPPLVTARTNHILNTENENYSEQSQTLPEGMEVPLPSPTMTSQKGNAYKSFWDASCAILIVIAHD